MRNHTHKKKPVPMMGFAGKFIRFTKYRVLGQDENGEDILGPGEDILSDPFDNMILDQGLDYLGSQLWDNLFAVHLGTGNVAPVGTETAISGYVAGSSTDGTGGESGISSDSTYIYRRISKRFAAGSASGVNLASVAVGHQVATGQIFSLALLKDTGGTPTTITLDADEVLDVVYELRAYLPLVDVVSTETVDGVSTSVTARRHSWATFASRVGRELRFFKDGNSICRPLADQLPASNPGTWISGGGELLVSAIPYVAGSHQNTVVVTVPLAVGNFTGGLGAIHLGQLSSGAEIGRWPYSFGFSPKLNKDASRTATVTVGLSWGRYTP